MSQLRGEWMGSTHRLLHYVYDGRFSACGFALRREYMSPAGTALPHKRSCALCRSIVNEAEAHCKADLEAAGYWRCMCLSCRKLREPLKELET